MMTRRKPFQVQVGLSLATSPAASASMKSTAITNPSTNPTPTTPPSAPDTPSTAAPTVLEQVGGYNYTSTVAAGTAIGAAVAIIATHFVMPTCGLVGKGLAAVGGAVVANLGGRFAAKSYCQSNYADCGLASSNCSPDCKRGADGYKMFS